MEIQWYPGHMTKAMRQMAEDMKLIDLVIELVDARVPVAGRNPDLERLGKGKARLLLLNKSDLADARENEQWKKYFLEQGLQTVLLDAQKNTGMNEIKSAIRIACSEKIERDRRRGIKNRPVRAMVVGIPNVGKSTFINSFAKKAVAKTGNRPGVTKGKQWIRLNPTLELLDTPGVLWPKFEDKAVGDKLAFTGAVKSEVIDSETLALRLIESIRHHYAQRICARYKIKSIEGLQSWEILELIGRKRGMLIAGGEVDTERASVMLLDEFKNGKLGKFTFEMPEDMQ